jgi:GntR family transcriptional regulator
MARKGTLVSRVSEDLRGQLAAGRYKPGSQLPTESALGASFEVSRPTIRAALRELEALGLVTTRHGVGTFVAEKPAVQAGLERLDSITESIRATGREPSMVYAGRVFRQALPEEAARMGLSGDTEVLDLRRMILADGEVMAYSYDLMPRAILPPDFDPAELEGSIFAFLHTRLGILANRGVAEVHAVSSDHVAWGKEGTAHNLYVLLNQLHYASDGRLVLYSRTYFIEGRYSFTVRRQG